ncbi:MAG: 50S ribosomal protein L17 [Bacteroidetes bacterium]|nr:50S ribosomal protein L17 [Bacteroidota bacterium]
MRHGKGFNHLGRTAPHRKAMLSNMASSLILNKRVQTTVAKAKALRPFVEKLITKSKSDSVHNRRTVFSYLQNKYSVQELFGPVADKVADRPGGYVRILKLGNRYGDNAEMCLMELVDFNEFIDTTATKKSSAKRSRRGSGAAKTKKSAPETTSSTEETEAAE